MRQYNKDSNRSKRVSDLNFVVDKPTELMVFLTEKLSGKNRRLIKALLRDKQVLVNDEPVSQFNHPLQPGTKVRVSFEKAFESSVYRGLKILHEDAHLVVVEKAAGVLSVATDKQKLNTAYDILNEYIKQDNPAGNIYVVHRLDRETSGVMMFAKSKEAQELLQKSWNDTILERTYLAVVEGTPRPPSDRITSFLVESKALIVYSTTKPGVGQEAITNYETVDSRGNYSLLKLNLETGRKNQIRVHMQDINHPIVGDVKYGSTKNPLNRLGLHALVLAFEHPYLRKNMRFETEVPAEFQGMFSKDKN